MKTALVILAAGIGSRFSGGIKQLTPVGPHEELIIDYSVFDALEAGFQEIVFIIRREMKSAVQEMIGDRLEALIGKIPNLERVSYVFQDMNDLPAGFDPAEVTAERTKPWGTGQAVLACREIVKCPFVVINADDFYGKEAFRRLHAFLLEHGAEQRHYCMAGFVLRNTLSDFGTVTRGLCRVREDGYLMEIRETRNLMRTEDGIRTNGVPVDPEMPVSMNMWGFTPDLMERLGAEFSCFLRENSLTDGEFILPEVIGKLLREAQVRVCCLPTQDSWFGVTYQEDKPIVKKKIAELTERGVYPSPLWG